MKYLIPIFILVFLSFPLIAEAQCSRLLPDYERSYQLCTIVSDIGIILGVFALALAIVIVIISGIQYMTAGGDEAKVTKAKKTLTYGLVGVAITLAAYFIVGLIENFIVTRLT